MSNPLTALTPQQLRRRTSLKWRAHPADVLPLWVAEMDVPLAEPIRLAMAAALEEGDTGYPVEGEYADAARSFAQRRWGWDLDTELTCLVPDVMRGIVEVVSAVTAPGDPVVVNPPVYPPFYAHLEHAGRRVVTSPLGPDHRLDLAHLEETFAALTRDGGRAAYVLCSPHNPTGTVHTRDELIAVAAAADRHGVRVVVDEIHAPIVYPGATHHPYLSLPGTGTGFALLSASKAFNLAGIKAALAVAGPDSADDVAGLPELVRIGATHLGVIAHVAGMRDGDGYLDALVRGLDENRRLLADLLGDLLPGVHHRVPDATYLAWLDCRDLGLADPATHFLEKGRVALTSGVPFGEGGEQHVRLNFATSPDILEDAVRRMASAL